MKYKGVDLEKISAIRVGLSIQGFLSCNKLFLKACFWRTKRVYADRKACCGFHISLQAMEINSIGNAAREFVSVPYLFGFAKDMN